MLETFVTQATGLHLLPLQDAPRLLAMASHGTQIGELSLLWSVCTALVDMGYPVLVLDANTTESQDNPGLDQLLGGPGWCGDAGREAAAWSVLPASRGLAKLCARPSSTDKPWNPLCGLFENFGVVVVYARTEILARLLPGSGIEPLVAVSPVKASPVTAYQSLKHMLLNAKLRSTVAAIAAAAESDETKTNHSPVKNLQECAMNFLGYRLHPVTVRAPTFPDLVSDDVQRLTLRLLENAMPLCRNLSMRAH